jgi:hypothetical protein
MATSNLNNGPVTRHMVEQARKIKSNIVDMDDGEGGYAEQGS